MFSIPRPKQRMNLRSYAESQGWTSNDESDKTPNLYLLFLTERGVRKFIVQT